MPSWAMFQIGNRYVGAFMLARCLVIAPEMVMKVVEQAR